MGTTDFNGAIQIKWQQTSKEKIAGANINDKHDLNGWGQDYFCSGGGGIDACLG